MQNKKFILDIFFQYLKFFVISFIIIKISLYKIYLLIIFSYEEKKSNIKL